MFKKKFKVRINDYAFNSVCVEYSHSVLFDEWNTLRYIKRYDHIEGSVYPAHFKTIEGAEDFAAQFKTIEDVIKHENEIDEFLRSKSMKGGNFKPYIVHEN